MRNDSIVCFAGHDWWAHNPLTEKQWMSRLAGMGWTVLFVSSIGIGIPGRESPRVGARLWRKLKSLARWLRRDGEVWVLTPFLIPLWSVGAIRRLNLLLITLQVRYAMKRAGMVRTVFWAGIPTAALLIDRIPHTRKVYYVQDNYTAYFDAMTFTRVHEDHDHMLRAADLVICASLGLQEREQQFADRCVYLPHGVGEAFLSAQLSGDEELPAALKDIPRPIIGYWGSLEALQDKELTLALARQHPEWSFVFIGRVMMDNNELAALPNVHYLGFLPMNDIPAIGRHFDIGFMSFVQSEWIAYSCPVKYREYLALGLPVVSPPIIEVERAYPGEGRVARTVEEFADAMREAMQEDSPERRAARRALVRDESWDNTAQHLHEFLTKLEGAS